MFWMKLEKKENNYDKLELYSQILTIKHLTTSWWFETHLKNISQNGNLPQIEIKIKNTPRLHVEKKKQVTPGVSGIDVYNEWMRFHEGRAKVF